MNTVTIEVAEEVLLAMQKDPESFAAEMRVAAAAKWYELGAISQGKAAQVAGLTRAEFVLALGRLGVTPFQETAEDIGDDRDR